MRHYSKTSRQSVAWVVSLIAALVVLSGCASLKVKMGMRVYLQKTPVSSIAASLPNGGIAPGEKAPLVVTVTTPDGKVLKSEGKGGGKVLWQDLQVTPTLVTVNKKGVVALPKDPRISEGKSAHVTISAPSHPDVQAAQLDIPIRYDYGYKANFSGSSGSPGINGTDGMNGMDGSMGSIDPNSPSPGGNGGDGTDGTNGTDGSSGGDAPSVRILVRPIYDTKWLLQVIVSATGPDRYYLIDPQGGSLTVTADGGAGGSGGKGGRGGRGGMGGIGSPNGMSGRDGSNGFDGSGGAQGRGGTITVIYDPKAKPYLGIIHLSNKNGPTPVFREDQLDPLW